MKNGETFKMNLHCSYGIGRVINTINGAAKIIEHGTRLDALPGGKGVCIMTLQKVSDQQHLTEAELAKLV